jgi:hypothetical protein
MSVGGMWEEPPDDWPDGAPWPPPLWPHPDEARHWRYLGQMAGGARIRLADGTEVEAGPGEVWIAAPGTLAPDAAEGEPA